MTNGIDRDALTREMKDWTAASGGTTISISNAVWIAMRYIQAARAEANISDYIRFIHNQSVEKIEQESTSEDYKSRFPMKLIRSFHKNSHG
jgi:hypothetical protein